MNRIKRYRILCSLRANNQHPVIELVYDSPFELLIAVLLSAQATDVSVNKVTRNLFQIANTPHAMLILGIDTIKTYIKSVGLFNIKSENIIKICRILLEQYQGKVPEDRAALEALPGVGRKTANIVLNIAFKWSTIAVDTHVFRVCNRTRFAVGKNMKSVEHKLLSVVPAEFKSNCHQWLVWHGRYICTAHKPHCNICLIENLCEFKEKHYN